MADDNSSLSQDEIDQLLNLGGEDAGGSDDGDLNLDSLLGGSSDSDSGGMTDTGLDADALSALTSAIGEMPSHEPSQSGGSKKSVSTGSRENVELLMDVTLKFTVELGRTQMYIKDVLMLGEGSIVELDKVVGDEVDILINDRLFGRGRLIVMDSYFGVQITYILDPLTRFRL